MLKSKYVISISSLMLAVSVFSVSDAHAQTVDQSMSEQVMTLPTGGVQVSELKEMTNREVKKVKKLDHVPVVYSREDLVREISRQMIAFNEVVQVKYMGTMTSSEISAIFKEAIHLEDYIYGTWAGSKYSFSSRTNPTITINMNYHHTKAQEQELTAAVKNIASTIIQPTMTEMEKVKAINDYVVLNTMYTYEGKGTKTTVHSPYTIINEGKGVCQAYALVAYRLLKEAGIGARYVTGYVSGPTAGYHAWNLVEVDGQWYHLDTTWNDPLFADSLLISTPKLKDYKRYNYFLLSDKSIQKDHKIDALGYPTTASTDYVFGLSTSDVKSLRLTVNGKTKWVMSEPIYMNGTWYVNDANTAQILRLKDGEKALVSAGEKAYGMTYLNDKIFFLNRYAYLYSYSLATGEVQQLLEEQVYLENDGEVLRAISTKDNKVRYQEIKGQTIDKTELESIISEAKGYLSTVTGSLYDALSTELQQANAVLKDNDATLGMVNTRIDELNKIIALVKKADSRQKLALQIEKASLEKTKIVAARLAMLQQAIARANDVYNNELSTAQDFEIAMKRLEEDLVNVYKEADKTLLNELLYEALDLQRSIYDQEVASAFNQGKQLSTDRWATTEMVTAEVDNLRKALDKVYNDNFSRTQLNKKIYEATIYAKRLNTSEAKNLLQEIANARSVSGNRKSTNKEIKQAFESLTNAMKVPTTQLNTEKLERLLNEVNYEATMATTEDAVVLLEAAEQAKKNEAQTQEELDEVVKKLQEILDNVKNIRVFNEDITTLQDFFTTEFAWCAENLIGQFNSLNQEKLSVDVQKRMQEIQKKYEELTAFNATLPTKNVWSNSPKETKDEWKPWTVTLSMELENSSDNLSNLQVVNIFGEAIKVDIKIEGKKVIITPLEQYKKDILYRLMINKELRSVKGKTLNKDLYMEFKVN